MLFCVSVFKRRTCEGLIAHITQPPHHSQSHHLPPQPFIHNQRPSHTAAQLLGCISRARSIAAPARRCCCNPAPAAERQTARHDGGRGSPAGWQRGDGAGVSGQPPLPGRRGGGAAGARCQLARQPLTRPWPCAARPVLCSAPCWLQGARGGHGRGRRAGD